MKIIEGFRLREVMGQATVVGEGVGQLNFNKLIILNASAAYLWKSIEGKEFTVEQLAELLTDRYGIDSEIARRDAVIITEEWMKNKVIE